MVNRDRIIGFEKVPSYQLQIHPKNFRVHNDEQKGAMQDILGLIGVAGAGVAYQSERYGGLTLIDGHMRKELLDQVPVVIVDLSDAEADALLAAYDRVTYLAREDQTMLAELTKSLEDLMGLEYNHLQRLLDVETGSFEPEKPDEKESNTKAPYEVVAEVDEGYDYVLIFCTRSMHHVNLLATLGLSHQQNRRGKVGVGRVMRYEQFMAWLDETKRKASSQPAVAPLTLPPVETAQ